jgi:hypothetical protein
VPPPTETTHWARTQWGWERVSSDEKSDGRWLVKDQGDVTTQEVVFISVRSYVHKSFDEG